MNGHDTTAGVLVSEKAAQKSAAKENEVSLSHAILMLPVALLGFTIAAFPISLPILYVVALLFV